MDQMRIIEELKTDSEFLAKLADAKDENEAKVLFAERGIKVTCEELKAIRNGDTSDELDENTLENVAGGSGLGIAAGIAIICFLAGFAKGTKCKK